MTDYRDGDWHGWNGGTLPVRYNDRIDYVWLHTKGTPPVTHHKNHRAGNICFEGNEYGDLIAFRVIQKHAMEFWLEDDGDGRVFVSETPIEGAIHVREVTEND